MDALGSQVGEFIERQRAAEALRASEERKGAMLESALDCVITIDHEGRVVEFNPAAEQIFGYTREEAVGTGAGGADHPARRSASATARRCGAPSRRASRASSASGSS